MRNIPEILKNSIDTNKPNSISIEVGLNRYEKCEGCEFLQISDENIPICSKSNENLQKILFLIANRNLCPENKWETININPN